MFSVIFGVLRLVAILPFALVQESEQHRRRRKAGNVLLEKMRQYQEQARLLNRHLDVKDWDAFDVELAAAKFGVTEHEQWLARKAQAIAEGFKEQCRAEEMRRQEELAQRLSEHLDAKDWDAFDAELTSAKFGGAFREQWLTRKAQAIIDVLHEKIPLDADQARIVASPAKTIRITARAGSGKTRLLRALSYFFVKQCGYKPDDILLLAFNRNAAEELERGLCDLLGVLAFPGARTFHSLAHGIVRPREAIVYDEGAGIGAKQLSALVHDLLKDILGDERGTIIRNFFRAETKEDLFADSLPGDRKHYDYRRALRQLTLGGSTVKSAGEKYIGDFLFEHGLEHYYEDSVWWNNSRYRPDFKIKAGEKTIYLEHWAFDPDAKIVSASGIWTEAKIREYRADAQRKREYWKGRKDVGFVETCADESRNRESFESILHERLAPHFGPLRKLPLAELLTKVDKIHLSRFAAWVAQAIQRTQKAGWSEQELKSKIEAHTMLSERENFFLKIVAQAYGAYGEKLARNGKTDFDQLFNAAIASLRADPPQTKVWNKGIALDLRAIKICLVDEAQDLSPQFRQALECIRSFNPDMRIVFVGDDWQAINRYAGSSVDIFTDEITARFRARSATLATNYRSGPQIVEAGNRLMAGQGEPSVAAQDRPSRIELACYDEVWVEYQKAEAQTENYRLDAPFRVEGGDGQLLKTLYQLAMPDLRDGKNVGVLFRNNNFGGMEINEMQDALCKAISDFGWPKPLVKACRSGRVKFSTAHKFKGAECDTIFVVSPHTGQYPSIQASSLELFRIFGDNLQQAVEDERRLFYVAITRAKQRLVFLCDSTQAEDSPFLDRIRPLVKNVSVPDTIILPPI